MDGDVLESNDNYYISGEDTRDQRSFSRIMGSSHHSTSTLARGIHITEFSESQVNPTPLLLEESDILLEQYLSPGKLQLLTGMDDLTTVESLELKVDSRETSLGNFGSLLPNLAELKLNGSCISCVRDLGSSLKNLKVLWMTRCGLAELDGISAMSELRELYLEYNEISDISPLSMLEHLEILDLEGNNIDDITQIQYLSFCPTLRKLALDGNPICVRPSPTVDEAGYQFREAIKKVLPKLLVLDDKRLDDDSSLPVKQNVFDEDWAYLEELQEDALLHEEFINKQNESLGHGDRPITAALRPATSYRPGSALRPSSGFHLQSAATRRPSTIGGSSVTPPYPGIQSSNRPSSSDAIEGLESVSELTMGNVICGNPSKALRQRRKGGPGSKEEISAGLNNLLKKGASLTPSEDRDDDEAFIAETEMNSIIEELRLWKLEHEKRIHLILKSKEAQILVVDHDDDDDNIDDITDEDESSSSESEPIDELGKYVYRPSAMRQHIADLRHRAVDTSIQGNVNSDKKRGDYYPDELSTSSVHAETADLYSNHVVYDQSFDAEGNSLDTGETHLSSSSSGHKQTEYLKSDFSRNVITETGKVDCQRLASRNEKAVILAPLKTPTPPSPGLVHNINKKTVESPVLQQKKLRVGPTGLPLTSQTQQPVMRNNVAVLQTRSGLIKCRPGGSPTNIVLLPSQPRIQRQLPETPPLVPNPPGNF